MQAFILTTVLCAAPVNERLFTELDVGLSGRSATAIAIAPNNDKLILTAVDGLLFRSSDGGDTFEVVFRSSAQTALPVEAELAADDANDEAAAEGGESDRETLGPDSFAPDMDAVDDSDVDAALDSLEDDLQESLKSKQQPAMDALPEGDNARDVKVPHVRELPGIRRILFAAPEVVYLATDKGLYRSTDAARSFFPLPLPHDVKVRNVRDVAVARDMPTMIVVATAGGGLRSLDGGESWADLPDPVGRSPALCVVVGAGKSPLVVVGAAFGVARSMDGGRTFDVLLLSGEGPQRPVLSLALDASLQRIYVVTPRMLFAGAAQARMLQPTGAAWREGLLVVRTRNDEPGKVWAGGRNGVFFSKDGGRTATEVGEEAMVRDVVDMAMGNEEPDALAVATSAGPYMLRKVGKQLKGISPLVKMQWVAAHEPTVQEVAMWAADSHRVDPTMVDGMRLRSRAAGLLPEVTVRGRGFPPPPSQLGILEANNVYTIVGIAQWNPDKLIFNAQEAIMVREHRRLLNERERIWKRVVRKYEARRRLQADMMAVESRSALSHAAKVLRMKEITSDLDAQTDGRFSQDCKRRGAPADGVTIDGPVGVGKR